jgi:hypothetical protein
MALGVMAGATVEKDPRSSDFGKLKIGNTRLDFLAGLSQVTVFGARHISGQTKSGMGQIKPLTGQVPYGQPTLESISGQFIRSKMAPIPGLYFSLRSGTDFHGKAQSRAEAIARALVPMSGQDVFDALKAEGFTPEVALSLVSFLGIGAQHQPDPWLHAQAVDELKRLHFATPADREAAVKARVAELAADPARQRDRAAMKARMERKAAQ